MNETAPEENNEAARRLGIAFGRTDFSNAANNCAAGDGILQPHAQVQGAGDTHRQGEKEVALPVLAEMGDIAPALEVLLRLQAEYARREPGVSRAMRDVAYHSVAAEIARYIKSRLGV